MRHILDIWELWVKFTLITEPPFEEVPDALNVSVEVPEVRKAHRNNSLLSRTIFSHKFQILNAKGHAKSGVADQNRFFFWKKNLTLKHCTKTAFHSTATLNNRCWLELSFPRSSEQVLPFNRNVSFLDRLRQVNLQQWSSVDLLPNTKQSWKILRWKLDHKTLVRWNYLSFQSIFQPPCTLGNILT